MIEHTTELRVIYADTDAMGVVYHTNYIKWFEVGRGELLRDIGFPYKTLEKENGIMLPVAECGCKYKSPAFYDDVLEIKAMVASVGRASVHMEYEIRRKETGELLVTGFTKHGVTDAGLKLVRLSDKCPALYEKIKG